VAERIRQPEALDNAVGERDIVPQGLFVAHNLSP
jgi:hypothetical protein